MESSTSTINEWLEALDAWALEDYDFDVNLHCEYRAHYTNHIADDPAKYLIRVSTSCSCIFEYLMCFSGYHRLVSRPTVHCESHGDGQLFNVKILETIR